MLHKLTNSGGKSSAKAGASRHTAPTDAYGASDSRSPAKNRPRSERGAAYGRRLAPSLA
jgi:hypothetical protein